MKNDNDEIVVKNYLKNKPPNIQQPKFKPPNCPSCKRNNWLEIIINKQKHEIDMKVRGQGDNFSTRLPYAFEKIRNIWMNIVKTTYNSTQDLIDKLQEVKFKTKILQKYK